MGVKLYTDVHVPQAITEQLRCRQEGLIRIWVLQKLDRSSKPRVAKSKKPGRMLKARTSVHV